MEIPTDVLVYRLFGSAGISEDKQQPTRATLASLRWLHEKAVESNIR